MTEVCEDCGRPVTRSDEEFGEDKCCQLDSPGAYLFSNCDEYTIKRLRERLTAAEAQLAERRWIPVTERLPDHGPSNGDSEWVLVFAPARGIDMAFYEASTELWHWNSHGYAIASEVSHWMALPAEPVRSQQSTGGKDE